MNAVVVSGTYHQNGAVSGLVEAFVAGLKEEAPDAEVRIVDLLEANVEFCRGCGNCTADNPAKAIGDCSITDDDVRGILEEMIEADVLVLATPVYELGPTALMKRFMERMLATLRPGKFGPAPRTPKRSKKVGVVLLSTGAPYPLNVVTGMTRYPAGILARLARGCGCGRIQTLKAGAVESSEKVRARYANKARDLGRKAGRAAQ
ncbi:MAG: flavodoxin family protein [Dehalococcoidia bacterium]|nr:flavodoxin family protein [Dehalococcoidia bacterium]